MKKRILSTAAFSIITLVILAGVLFLLQRLLVPKYADELTEGRFIAEYYKEESKDYDVIFLGDCEVYENFSPASLWEEYGINSYIRGSAQQYIWQSYYLLEDTLKYDTPSVCVYNVQALQYEKATNEAYNRMTLEGMRWSPSKVKSIITSMRDDEHFTEYVFPILRYHSRWDELENADIEYMFKEPRQATYNGYYMRLDIKPAENFPEGKPLADYSFSERSWQYLDMIRMKCEANGIALVLIKAPSLYPYWYDEWDEQVEDYAKRYDIRYVNFYDVTDEIGLDYSTDTYDGGLHMNLYGAQKMSSYIGSILLEEGAQDRREDEKLSAIWDEKLSAYNAEIVRQESLIEKEEKKD